MTAKKKTTSTKTHTTTHAHGAAATSEEATTTTKGSTPPATTGSAAIPSTAAAPASTALDSRIQQVIASLSTIPIILGSAASPATPLTIEQRRAQPKIKKGGEAQVTAVLNLADQYGIVIPGGGTAEARTDMAYAETLLPLSVKLAAMLRLVQDEASAAKSRGWGTTTMAYVMLTKLQKRFPALQTELDPMASFMARKHKDAPTILRQAESRTLSKSRATLEQKKEKGAPAPAAGAPVGQAVAPQAAPVVSPAPAQTTASGGNGTAASQPVASAVVTPAAANGGGSH